MQRLSGLMREIADQEIERWPRGEPLALHPRLQALTLEIILRAVFGLGSGERLSAEGTRRRSITLSPKAEHACCCARGARRAFPPRPPEPSPH